MAQVVLEFNSTFWKRPWSYSGAEFGPEGVFLAVGPGIGLIT